MHRAYSKKDMIIKSYKQMETNGDEWSIPKEKLNERVKARRLHQVPGLNHESYSEQACKLIV